MSYHRLLCVDLLSGALLVTVGAVPLVETQRLAALPLANLTRLLLGTIDRAFNSGCFLSPLRDSLSRADDGTLKLQVRHITRPAGSSMANGPPVPAQFAIPGRDTQALGISCPPIHGTPLCRISASTVRTRRHQA